MIPKVTIMYFFQNSLGAILTVIAKRSMADAGISKQVLIFSLVACGVEGDSNLRIRLCKLTVQQFNYMVPHGWFNACEFWDRILTKTNS